MQSFMSLFAYSVLRIGGYKNKMNSPRRSDKYIESLRKKNRKPCKPMCVKKYREEALGNAQLFHINEQEAPKTLILYLHGGGYCEGPIVFHWQFMAQLEKHVGAQIDMLLYPRGPEHHFDETFEILEEYYRNVIKKVEPQRIVFMGDSSGGGLCMAFAEHLVKLGLPQPRELILFSPWTDLRMEYTKIPKSINFWDPSISCQGLRKMAEAWANGTSLEDPRISPLLGNFEGLTKMTAFFGTHELLCLDLPELKRKAKAAGVDLRLEVFKNMNHVFVYFPTPEGQIAKNMVYEILNSN